MARRATTTDKRGELADVMEQMKKRDAAPSAKKPTADPKAARRSRASKPPPGSPGPLRLEYVQAKTLTPNPSNWRKHPKRQLDALRQTLGDDDIGWAGALLFNERTGRLVDGHGRLEVTDPEAFVPVLIGSWSESAERKILATLDPLAAMARADTKQLDTLLAELEVDGFSIDSGDALGDVLAALPELVPIEEPGDEGPEEDLDGAGSSGGGDADNGYEPTSKILLTCNSSTQQETLIDVIDRLSAGEKVALAVIADAFAGVVSKALNG